MRLIQNQMRLSARPPQKIGEWWKSVTWKDGADDGDTIRVSNRDYYKLSDVYADESWAIDWSLVSLTQSKHQPEQFQEKDNVQFRYNRDCFNQVRDSLFKDYKTASKTLGEQMAVSLSLLMEASGIARLTVAQTAYLISTGIHETKGFTDFEEDYSGNSAYHYFENKYGYKTAKGQSFGHTEIGQGFLYRGQGIIQLTGLSNYQWAYNKFGENVVGSPGLLQSNKALSAIVAAVGIKEGQFGGKISNYINGDGNNFGAARNAVNSRDFTYRNKIANKAEVYLQILRNCQ